MGEVYAKVPKVTKYTIEELSHEVVQSAKSLLAEGKMYDLYFSIGVKAI